MKALRNTKMIYITSLSGEWKHTLEQIFSIETAKIHWNPGGRQIEMGVKVIGRYLKNTYVLQLNKDEAIGLVYSDPQYQDLDNEFLNNTQNLAKILKSWGPEIVLITEGKEGSTAYDGNRFYHQNILAEKKRVDTTGVGDCFGSTFAAALIYTEGDIQKSMRLGAKNTASVISRQGAQNGLLTEKQLFK
jgi:sugar/nucleoside kinase (ribokinase family)